jgi:hypothetical protein
MYIYIIKAMNFVYIFFSFQLGITVTHMARSGLRGTFLSGYTNLRAGYRPSNTYKPRYWLYAMLCDAQ